MTSWIFQGNPKQFKINEYLKRENINWTVKQYGEEMSPNDVVYIWRADGNIPKSGGIVAKGKITGKARTMQDDAPDLWIDNKPQSSDVLRVPIKIEDVRHDKNQGMLMRVDLKRNDVLKDMRILKMPQQTNYKLEPKHSDHINKLWDEKRKN